MDYTEENKDLMDIVSADTLPTETGLQPLNWQDGNIAMSPSHFYMVYNDSKLGITVLFTNKVTNKSSSRDGFETMDSAKEWVKKSHNAVKENQDKDYFEGTGLRAGQRWAHKFAKYVIIEIKGIEDNQVCSIAYAEKNPNDASGVNTSSVDGLKDSLKTDCFLMLNGETVDQCMTRNMGRDD